MGAVTIHVPCSDGCDDAINPLTKKSPHHHRLKVMRVTPSTPPRNYDSAKKLSSTDWSGFDLIWQKRMGNTALKNTLDNHLKFEQVSLCKRRKTDGRVPRIYDVDTSTCAEATCVEG